MKYVGTKGNNRQAFHNKDDCSFLKDGGQRMTYLDLTWYELVPCVRCFDGDTFTSRGVSFLMATDNDPEDPILDTDLEGELAAQEYRQKLYDEGIYELSDTKGFFCEECEWRGLTAPSNTEEPVYKLVKKDKPICVCPECGAGAYTKESDTDHLEQFISEYEIEVEAKQ